MPAKLLHILGGGQWQLPTIALAKHLGFRVLISDMYTDRPGYALADAHECVDITDRDSTLRCAERHGIDGIVCDTTDVGVPTMAWVADKLGLPGIGYETALNFTNKARMREVTSKAGVPNPPFRSVRDSNGRRSAALEIGFPLVVKPVDSQSSRGVQIVRDSDRLPAAFEEAQSQSKRGEVIVEGFLDGTEITVEGYCVDGQPYVAGISDKGHFAHRPEVADRLTYPADLSAKVIRRAVEVNEQTVRALGLKNGVTHAEYMVVGEELYLVEVAARGGGNRLYSHIAPYLAGVPLCELYLRFTLGEGMHAGPPLAGTRAANLGFFSFPAGKVLEISGVDEARAITGVQEILLEFGVGDSLRLAQDDRSRAGFALVFGETREDVLQTTRRVFETVRVSIA